MLENVTFIGNRYLMLVLLHIFLFINNCYFEM